MTTYTLHAIRYATNPGRRRADNFMYAGAGDDHDAPMPLDFYVWLARGNGRAVLVDGGANEAACRARGHQFLRCPTEGLGALGVDPHDITDVISTHLHWDHAGNFEKFPNARFHIQSAELAHATGECMCQPVLRRPFDVEQVCTFLRLLYGGRVNFHHGQAEIAPGIDVLQVGGHTPGLQAVRVATARGNVVLASDAMHFFQNRDLSNPFPVLVDLRDYVAGWQRVAQWADSADHLIPGHDPLVFKRYPAVSPELQEVAVRLDVAPRPEGQP